MLKSGLYMVASWTLGLSCLAFSVTCPADGVGRFHEQAEIDAAVSPVLYKFGHVGKRVVLAMLEDEYAAGLEQVALEDEPGQPWHLGNAVWRVGEYEVKLLAAVLDEAEYVAAQGNAPVGAQFGKALLDEGVVVAVGFDADH